MTLNMINTTESNNIYKDYILLFTLYTGNSLTLINYIYMNK